MEKSSSIISFINYRVPVVALIVLSTFLTLISPARVDALKSASCPTGFALRYAQGTAIGGLTPYYLWTCIDANGNRTDTIWTNAASCPQGQQELVDKNAPFGDPICVPSGTSQTSYTDCSPGWFGFTLNPMCWGRMLGALIAQLFSWVGALILTVAGYLFNYSLEYTVIAFKTQIYERIQSAIELGWSVFRDLSNLVIIGIFTFIALSIIMGLKTYGQKKLIANVLIVAVLINFSLLFTKMVIDVSNFSAWQFYRAAIIQTSGAGTAAGAATPVAADSGVSGAFMDAININSAWDTYKQVREIQDKGDNGLVGFAVGMMNFMLYVGAAIVLFYGSFLLITRAVLLIFLMLTSALAFATYLIPNIEKASYGWKTWVESLAKSAVMAPMLMLFLWITLAVAKALRPIMGGKTLGGAYVAPESNIAALFGYLLILGLLFLSFKLSSKFASKIAGFSTAAMVPGAAIGLGLRSTAFGMNKVGKYSAKARDAMKDAGWTDADKHTGIKGWGMRRMQGTANALAKTNFNPMQSKNKALGKLTSALGIPKALSGGKSHEGGFDGRAERKAKAGDAYQKAMAPSASYFKAKSEKIGAETRATLEEELKGKVAVIADLENEQRDIERAHMASADYALRTGASEELAKTEADLSRNFATVGGFAHGEMANLVGNQQNTLAAQESKELARIATLAHQTARDETDTANTKAASAEDARQRAATARKQADDLKAEADSNPSDTAKQTAATEARNNFVNVSEEADRLAKEASDARAREEQAHTAARTKIKTATVKLEVTKITPVPGADTQQAPGATQAAVAPAATSEPATAAAGAAIPSPAAGVSGAAAHTSESEVLKPILEEIRDEAAQSREDQRSARDAAARRRADEQGTSSGAAQTTPGAGITPTVTAAPRAQAAATTDLTPRSAATPTREDEPVTGMEDGEQRIRTAQAALVRARAENEHVTTAALRKAQEFIEADTRIGDLAQRIDAKKEELYKFRIDHGVKGANVYSGNGDTAMLNEAAEKASKDSVMNTRIALGKTVVWDKYAQQKIADQIRGREKKEKIADVAATFVDAGAIAAPPPAPEPVAPAAPAVPPSGGPPPAHG